MQNSRYRLVDQLRSGEGFTVYTAEDQVLDRPVTCIRLEGSLHTSPLGRAYRDLWNTKHPNTLQILDVVQDKGGFYVVTHQMQGLDADKWSYVNGKVSVVEALRFAREIVEWVLVWRATHKTWPYLLTSRVWITRNEDDNLELKVGRVVAPVPEVETVYSLQSVIASLLCDPEFSVGYAKLVLPGFFGLPRKQPHTMDSLMSVLDHLSHTPSRGRNSSNWTETFFFRKPVLRVTDFLHSFRLVFPWRHTSVVK